jgi:hypothetical protein
LTSIYSVLPPWSLSAPHSAVATCRRNPRLNHTIGPAGYAVRIAAILAYPAKLLLIVKIIPKIPSYLDKKVVCYLITVTKATPYQKIIQKYREPLLLFLIIGIIGALYSWTPPKSQVSISGLHLGVTAKQVERSLGTPNFYSLSHGAYILEYYAFKQKPGLRVFFHGKDGAAYRIEGGIPMVDGENALDWSLDQVVQRLGAPQNSGQGRAVGESARGFLAYPELRLLVQQENGQTRFILFESGR